MENKNKRGLKMKNLAFGLLIISALLLSGCSSGVQTLKDVNILDEQGNFEDLVDSKASLEETAAELGIEEADSDLIEFGELI